jgi:hypothetical protein
MTAPSLVVVGAKECLRDVKRIKGSQTTMMTVTTMTMMTMVKMVKMVKYCDSKERRD